MIIYMAGFNGMSGVYINMNNVVYVYPRKDGIAIRSVDGHERTFNNDYYETSEFIRQVMWGNNDNVVGVIEK